MSQHWLNTRYAGRCQICRSVISIGDQALWDTVTKKLTCHTCGMVSKHGPEMDAPFHYLDTNRRTIVSELFDDLTGEKTVTVYDDGYHQFEPFLVAKAAKHVATVVRQDYTKLANVGAYCGCSDCITALPNANHFSSSEHLSAIFGIPRMQVHVLMIQALPDARELIEGNESQEGSAEGVEVETAPIIYRGYYMTPEVKSEISSLGVVDKQLDIVLSGAQVNWPSNSMEATCHVISKDPYLNPRDRCLKHLLQGQSNTQTKGKGDLQTWPTIVYRPPVSPTMSQQICLCGIHGYYNPHDVLHHQADNFTVLVQCVAWGNVLYADYGLKASDVEMLQGWILKDNVTKDSPLAAFVDWDLVKRTLWNRYQIPFEVCEDEQHMLWMMHSAGIYRESEA